MNSTFCFALLCLTLGVVVDALDIGTFQPLTPTAAEKQICENNADGKEIRLVFKKIWHTCYVQCWYKGEKKAQQFLTPDGTLCCDIGGGGPTGTCSNGRCVPFWAQLV